MFKRRTKRVTTPGKTKIEYEDKLSHNEDKFKPLKPTSTGAKLTFSELQQRYLAGTANEGFGCIGNVENSTDDTKKEILSEDGKSLYDFPQEKNMHMRADNSSGEADNDDNDDLELGENSQWEFQQLKRVMGNSLTVPQTLALPKWDNIINRINHRINEVDREMAAIAEQLDSHDSERKIEFVV